MMLQITSTYPRMNVEIYWPEAEMQQKVSQIQISTVGPELQIDQQQSRNELGIVDITYSRQQVRDAAYQKTMEAIANIAAQGDEVVQRAGHFKEEMIIADQAKRATAAKIPELTIRAAPRTRPQIRFNYRQEISWNQGGVNIEHQVRPPEITWKLGGVNVDVRG